MSSDGGKRSVSEQEQGEPVLWAAKESMFMWGKSDESGHPYHIVCKGKKVKSHQIPLYTTPQQPSTIVRTWISLTAEEISSIEHKVYSQTIQKGKPMKAFIEQFAKAIDLALKGKNHHA